MRKLFTVIFSLLLVLILLQGCGTANQVSTGEQFSLSAGESAEVEGEYIKITFKSVVSDSRCPEGAECVTAGEARCDIEIIYQGASREFQIAQKGGTMGDTAILYKDYEISYNLTPYPQTGEQISPEAYKLVLKVEK